MPSVNAALIRRVILALKILKALLRSAMSGYLEAGVECSLLPAPVNLITNIHQNLVM
jgi:hypothetical protein